MTTNFEVIYKELFEIAAKIIKNEFGLSLFGFDVIISDDNKTEQVHAVRTYLLTYSLTYSLTQVCGLQIIDVNYFPSFKEVRDFPERLRKFLFTKCIKK